MKIGIISSPALLAVGLDLLDVYSVDDMFDEPSFILNLSKSKRECDYSFISIEGIGLFPCTYQSIPLTPIKDGGFEGVKNLEDVYNKILDFVPIPGCEKVYIDTFGHFPKDMRDAIFG